MNFSDQYKIRDEDRISKDVQEKLMALDNYYGEMDQVQFTQGDVQQRQQDNYHNMNDITQDFFTQDQYRDDVEQEQFDTDSINKLDPIIQNVELSHKNVLVDGTMQEFGLAPDGTNITYANPVLNGPLQKNTLKPQAPQYMAPLNGDQQSTFRHAISNIENLNGNPAKQVSNNSHIKYQQQSGGVDYNSTVPGNINQTKINNYMKQGQQRAQAQIKPVNLEESRGYNSDLDYNNNIIGLQINQANQWGTYNTYEQNHGMERGIVPVKMGKQASATISVPYKKPEQYIYHNQKQDVRNYATNKPGTIESYDNYRIVGLKRQKSQMANYLNTNYINPVTKRQLVTFGSEQYTRTTMPLHQMNNRMEQNVQNYKQNKTQSIRNVNYLGQKDIGYRGQSNVTNPTRNLYQYKNNAQTQAYQQANLRSGVSNNQTSIQNRDTGIKMYGMFTNDSVKYTLPKQQIYPANDVEQMYSNLVYQQVW